MMVLYKARFARPGGDFGEIRCRCDRLTGVLVWVFFILAVISMPTLGQAQDSSNPLLVWTSGSLRPGFVTAVRSIPGVVAATVVRAGNVGLVGSWDRSGVLVYRVQNGYSVPLEAMVLDLKTYRSFVPLGDANIFDSLGEREVLLSATSARIRGVGAGGRLELSDGTVLVVRAVVHDARIGGGELAVADSAWAKIAVPTERYMLIQYDGDRTAFESAAAAAVSDGAPVRVRGEGEAPIFRYADAVRPQAAIKEVFGEFFYRPREGQNIDREADWVEKNIVRADVALLGSFKCHRILVPALAGAMQELIALDLEFLIDQAQFRGCDNPRFIAGGRGLSRHAWGAAVDLNYGLKIASDPRLIAVMERWGFTSGHDWLIPDPGHFEFYGPATP